MRGASGLEGLRATIARYVAGRGLPKVWRTPDDAEIRRILLDWVESQRQSLGIVVGLVGPAGRRVLGHGVCAIDDTAPLDGRTVFEIGSVTKVFTALLLADMACKGEVRLDQPVADLLSATTHVPARGRQITLQDLATHTSALPPLPTNFAPADAGNPYADYTQQQLEAFLADYALPYDIGRKHAYSNLGAGLLGHALARHVGTDYGSAIRTRICVPLGLEDTVIALSPEQVARLAPGHDRALEPTSNWDLPTLAGAGALRSTADDMLTFLEQAMDLQPSPHRAAFDTLLTVRHLADGPMEAALGWHVLRAGKREIVWHNGGTGGYRSFVGFDPTAKAGVVVLTNAANDAGCDDIGFHLLTGRPLAKLKPPITRTTVRLGEAELAGLSGEYKFGGALTLYITVEGSRVMAQLTGQPEFEIYPESPTHFFWKVVDAQLTFERRPDGQATGVKLHQAGRILRARRGA